MCNGIGIAGGAASVTLSIAALREQGDANYLAIRRSCWRHLWSVRQIRQSREARDIQESSGTT